MSEERDLQACTEELRREVDRLQETVKNLEDIFSEALGNMVLTGLRNAAITLPLQGLTIYLAVRLALRKGR